MKCKFMTADPLYYDLLRDFARENRKYQTEAERCLWQCLRKGSNGHVFKRQHIIGRYIADFVCIDAKLIIEVDGGYHAQYAQKSYDAMRTHELENMGFRIIRFSNEQIIGDIDNVIETIIKNTEGNG